LNKKEAIAYAQITLESILHSAYEKELTLENFGIEMKQAFKMYPRNIVLSIAESKIFAEKQWNTGCDKNEKWRRMFRNYCWW